MFLVYNSDILHESEFRLSVNDRAFSYGDGLFETIRYESGRVWFWDDHISRLTEGMKALHLIPPANLTADTLLQSVLRLLDANDLTGQPARIKIQMWRQTGGLYTPATNEANLVITAQPGKPFAISEKAKVGIYEAFRLSYSPVSAFKTLNALPYILAGIHKDQHTFDEVLLLDMQGNLAECLASSLFWYAGKTLYTPSLGTGCVDGIVRRQLLRFAPSVGIVICEGLYPPEALQQAEAVFCANVMGIQWLNQVNNYVIRPSVEVRQRLSVLLSQLHI